MSVQGTKRKSAAEFNAEHEDFLLMLAEQRPELEIAVCLSLSPVQFQAHILEALKKQEVSPDDLKPSYEAVYAQSLPAVIREQMSLASKANAKALVKVETQKNGVLLSLLRAASSQQDQTIKEDAQDTVMDSTEEETV